MIGLEGQNLDPSEGDGAFLPPPPSEQRSYMPAACRLPAYQRAVQQKIRGICKEEGLDFFEVSIEPVDQREMCAVAAYGGFPSRYPHWSFGESFDKLIKGHTYGVQKIYELVVNTDPCYAYLQLGNLPVDQKLVIAHVYGHSDFFKNNMYFAHTNRRMMDVMGDHGARIRSYIDRYGKAEVANFLDMCLSVDDLIDVHSVAIRRHEKVEPYAQAPEFEQPRATRFEGKPYMQDFINPRETLRKEEEKLRQEFEQRETKPTDVPERDVLLYLLKYAPLKRWQHDVLSIVRDEAYYFAPQGMTKVLNEGWASKWHSHIMTNRLMVDPSEVIDYCDHHSGVLAVSGKQLNPYKLGLELLRDVEKRWDTGRFGAEYENCDDLELKRSWDRKLGLGKEKLFMLRRVHNDITFLDEFLTPEFCEQQKLFSFKHNDYAKRYEIESREFQKVKTALLDSLTNYGKPVVTVMSGNYANRGELLLHHDHKGQDLELRYAEDVLDIIAQIWARPANLQTRIDNRSILLSHDGKSFTQKSI